jgi:hypothetical protein
MWTVLLPPGGNPIAVNKYIISYHIISYHIISYHIIIKWLLYFVLRTPHGCSASLLFSPGTLHNLIMSASSACALRKLHDVQPHKKVNLHYVQSHKKVNLHDVQSHKKVNLHDVQSHKKVNFILEQSTKAQWGSRGSTRWCSWLRHCAANGKERVRFPMVLLEFFIYIILPAALFSWGRLSL